MSSAMSLLVTIGTLLSLLVFFVLLQMNRRADRPGELMDHEFDGIREIDNPLPGWWYWMYVLSIIFGLGYLAYYPGLGNFEGFVIGFIRHHQHFQRVTRLNRPLFCQGQRAQGWHQ